MYPLGIEVVGGDAVRHSTFKFQAWVFAPAFALAPAAALTVSELVGLITQGVARVER
jgi:hypothetical protein